MIQMNDFRAEPQALVDAELKACRKVLESGWYVLGEEVKRFEASWAQRCGTRRAVGVGNGLDAIEASLRALGIGQGDEVITTPMTAFASILGIIRAGATPVLADICPETALLDVESVERCIGSNTKAVLLVHLYGQVRSMKMWKQFCEQHKLHLIEDCAQAHLASEGEHVAGSFGIFGAYSFYPTKNLGAIGDGGALITNDEALAEKVASIRNYGQSTRYEHSLLGMNSRLDEMQAAILNVRLGWLTKFTERRRQIASRYLAEIDNPKIGHMAPPVSVENHVYHLFVIKCSMRERLTEHLRSNGIGCLIHYPIPAHQQKVGLDFRCDPNGLVQTESHARECLSIPCHHNMPDAAVLSTIEAINAFQP